MRKKRLLFYTRANGTRLHVRRRRRRRRPIAPVLVRVVQHLLLLRRLGRTGRGVQPVVAVGRGRIPSGGGGGGGGRGGRHDDALMMEMMTVRRRRRRRMMGRRGCRHRTAASRRHRLRPVGSATAVPGPFLAGALPLGRAAVGRQVILLYLFVVLVHQRLELEQNVSDVLQHSHRRLVRVIRPDATVFPQHGYLLTIEGGKTVF